MSAPTLTLASSVPGWDSQNQRLNRDLQILVKQQRGIAEYIAELSRVTHHIYFSHLARADGAASDDADDLAAAESERQDLVSVIQGGLRRQEDGLELFSQQIDNAASASAFSRQARPANVSLPHRMIFGLSRETGHSSRPAGEGGNASGDGGTDIKAELELQLAKLREDWSHCRSQFRRVQLQGRLHKESVRRRTAQQTIQALAAQSTVSTPNIDGTRVVHSSDTSIASPMGMVTSPNPRKRKAAPVKTQDDARVAAAKQATAVMQETYDLLLAELDRSDEAARLFQQSSEQLQGLVEMYSSLDKILFTSRSLVKKLLQTTKSDTWYLEMTLYVLVGTISWLLFRRLLYGPLWWFVWLPLKLLYKVSSLLIVSTGLFKSASKISSVELVEGGMSSVSSAVEWISPESQIGDQVMTVTAFPVSDAIAASIEAASSSSTGSSSGEPNEAGESSKTDDEPVVRGDGKPLAHSDERRNPKKRMLEEPKKSPDEEPKKQDRPKRDEL